RDQRADPGPEQRKRIHGSTPREFTGTRASAVGYERATPNRGKPSSPASRTDSKCAPAPITRSSPPTACSVPMWASGPAAWLGAGGQSQGLRELARTARFAADHVDRVVGVGDDVEVAVRPLLDVRGDAEAGADPQRLALGALELGRGEEVVGDAVGQARVGAD